MELIFWRFLFTLTSRMACAPNAQQPDGFYFLQSFVQLFTLASWMACAPSGIEFFYLIKVVDLYAFFGALGVLSCRWFSKLLDGLLFCD